MLSYQSLMTPLAVHVLISNGWQHSYLSESYVFAKRLDTALLFLIFLFQCFSARYNETYDDGWACVQCFVSRTKMF